MDLKKITHGKTLLFFMIIGSNGAVAEPAENQCFNTSTETWAEKQVYLLFESESQRLRRVSCQKGMEFQRKQVKLDAKYASEFLNDDDFRRTVEMLAVPGINSLDKSQTSAKFQTMTSNVAKNRSNSIPTVKGFETISPTDD